MVVVGVLVACIPAAPAGAAPPWFVRCSEVANDGPGRVTGVRLPTDLLVDTDCHLTDVTVAGSVLVEGASLTAEHTVVETWLQGWGDVALVDTVVRGGLHLIDDAAAADSFTAVASTVRGTSRAAPTP